MKELNVEEIVEVLLNVRYTSKKVMDKIKVGGVSYMISVLEMRRAVEGIWDIESSIKYGHSQRITNISEFLGDIHRLKGNFGFIAYIVEPNLNKYRLPFVDDPEDFIHEGIIDNLVDIDEVIQKLKNPIPTGHDKEIENGS